MTEDGPSLRDRLRRDTSEGHASVDGLFGSCDFATLDGYKRFLVAQAAAWETLRPALSADSLDRADALRSDLAALDIARPPAVGADAIPDAASLGLRYVLEGSRLGSTLLLRALEAKSPGVADRAGAYLRESARIEPWKQLSTRLQTEPGDADSAEAVIADARLTFGLFEKAWWATQGARTETAAG